MGKRDTTKRFEELKAKKLAEAGEAQSILEGIPNIEDNTSDAFSNPLLGSGVIERDYSTGKNTLNVIGNIPDSIPEPEIAKQTIDFTQSDDTVIENTTDSNTESSQQNRAVFNEEMSSEDKAEQRAMTGNFSDTIIDGYKLLISMIKNNATKSREKYQWLAVQGKFDMRVLKANVDMGDGQLIAYGDFIEGYNEQIEIIMCLDPNKEKEMRALLKRIALKKGLGMSDEMRLTLLVAEDVLTKAVTMFNLNKTLKNIEAFMLKQVQTGSATYSAPKQEQSQQQQNTTNQGVRLTDAPFDIKEDGEK